MAADAEEGLRWRLPRCVWEHHAITYRDHGSTRSRFWWMRVHRPRRWKGRGALYEPGWRFMMRRYDRALSRGVSGDYKRLAYWSENRPRETGYGIHNNDWWHM